jgi:hypothetical protein
VKGLHRSRYMALTSVAVAAPLWAACGSSSGGSAADRALVSSTRSDKSAQAAIKVSDNASHKACPGVAS